MRSDGLSINQAKNDRFLFSTLIYSKENIYYKRIHLKSFAAMDKLVFLGNKES